MNDTNMNRLPVPTWNQCGVNTAPAAAALPEPAGDWGEANFAVTLPAGVGESEEEFTAFSESGMGAEVDAFMLENATVRHALTVAEGVTVAEPAVFEFTLDAAHPNAVSVLDVDVKANASVTLVQVLRGDAENGVAANLVRIRAAEGAHVKLVQVQLLVPAAGTPWPWKNAPVPAWSRCAWNWAAAFLPAAPARCWTTPRPSMTSMPSTLAVPKPCWTTTMSRCTLPRTPCARCTPPVC